MIWILVFFSAFLEYPFEAYIGAGNRLLLESNPLSLFHMAHTAPMKPTLSISLSKPFSIDDLKFGEVAFSGYGLSIGAQYFGLDVYSEKTLGISIKRKMGEYFEIASSVRFTELYIEGFEPERGINVDISFGEKRKAVSWGALLRNLVRNREIALSIEISKKEIKLVGDLSHIEGRRPSFSISSLISLTKDFSIIFGVSKDPPTVNMGVIINSNPRLVYGYHYHLLLGGFSAMDATLTID